MLMQRLRISNTTLLCLAPDAVVNVNSLQG
jgi:hypothetical protein